MNPRLPFPPGLLINSCYRFCGCDDWNTIKKWVGPNHDLWLKPCGTLFGLLFSFILSLLVVWRGPLAWDFQQFCKYPLTLDVAFPFWTALLEALLAFFLSCLRPYSPLSPSREPTDMLPVLLLFFLPQTSKKASPSPHCHPSTLGLEGDLCFIWNGAREGLLLPCCWPFLSACPLYLRELLGHCGAASSVISYSVPVCFSMRNW